jgi:D-alanine-D-alanine ligase
VLFERTLTDFTEVNIAAYSFDGKVFVSRAEKPLSAHELLTFEDKYKTFSKKESKRVFPFEHSLVEKMRECAENVYKGIYASGIIRIDFLIDNTADRFYVNEINSLPGSMAHYLFPEISFSDLLNRIIENAITENKKRNLLTYVYETNIFDLKGK